MDQGTGPRTGLGVRELHATLRATLDAEQLQAEVQRERAAAEEARTDLAKAELRLEALPALEARFAKALQVQTTLAHRAITAEAEAKGLVAALDLDRARLAKAEAAAVAERQRGDQALAELAAARVAAV